MRLLLTSIFALCLVTAQGAFKCPSEDGQFEDEFQCDKYYKCQKGVAEELLCPDGLVFDPLKRGSSKCDHPFNADCGDRVELQPAQSTEDCPRRNGYFAHRDPSNCHEFVTCIDGVAKTNTCPAGLVFDENTGNCAWPAVAQRSGCVRIEKLADGFTCPEEKQLDANGNFEAHPRYPHPTNCRSFYLCLNGITPRETGCELGEVYNPDTKQCDLPENVEGCEDWYKDDPVVGGDKQPGDRRVFKS